MPEKMSGTEAQLMVQFSVLFYAVTAMYREHPRKLAVREEFERLAGRFQANVAASGAASLPVMDAFRKLADSIFDDPEGRAAPASSGGNGA